LIRSCGARPGVVLNPATPLNGMEWILEFIDFVLLMSVNPGFVGQSFIPNTLEKTRRLKQMINDINPSVLIQIDGGVNLSTIADISGAGADVFVAGSAVFGSSDYAKTISEMKQKAGQAAPSER
jgi:ribulose-phosphate 3-epimerase